MPDETSDKATIAAKYPWNDPRSVALDRCNEARANSVHELRWTHADIAAIVAAGDAEVEALRTAHAAMLAALKDAHAMLSCYVGSETDEEGAVRQQVDELAAAIRLGEGATPPAPPPARE